MLYLIWVIGLFSLGSLLMIFFGIFLLLFRVIAYVLIALGLYKVAVKRNLSYPWMAWIPIMNLYLLGSLLHNELSITPTLKIPSFQFILPALYFMMFLAGDSMLGSLLSFASYVLIVFSFIALFRQYREPNAVFFGVLAGLPVINIIGCFLVYPLDAKPTPEISVDATVFPWIKH